MPNNQSSSKSRREKQREYYLKNRERIRKKQQEYYLKNRDKIREQQRVYYAIFREKIENHRRKRRLENPDVRAVHNLRGRISHIINGNPKEDSTMALIGCPREHLMRHLEVQFKKGMSWENYGQAWHIDHKIPISAFDANKPSEMRTCFHFSNLQPMWAGDNMSKGGKVCLES